MSADRPGAKRVRLGERTMLACIHCKSKKLKCDVQTPKCQNCSRTGRVCLVEDPATGLHRPRDYLKSLEARVAYLEALLQKTRPEVALDHLDGTEPSNAVPRPSRPQPLPEDAVPHLLEGGIDCLAFDNNSPNVGQDGDDETIDDLSTDVALLCLSAAGREPHYFGPSCAVSFSRIVSATMGLPKRHGSSQHSGGHIGDQGPELQRAVSISFPSPNLAASLTQAYFKNIHPQYPFLHKPTFLAWEELCSQANRTGDVAAAGDLPVFFVLMVYAIGSLALGTAHRDAAHAYYSMALDHQATVLDLDGLESIQSILCCAVFSIRSPVGVSLWKISGMAIRHCIELGYHRSVTKFRKHTDTLTAEMSRRCFWVAYDIDRVAAFILGRPVGIPDDSIDVEMPLDLEDEYITREGLKKEPRSSPSDPPTYMTGAIHVVKLRRLWSKFADELYPTTTKSSLPHSTTRQVLAGNLRQELEEWYSEIPDAVDYAGSHPLSVFASKAWFTLGYDHSILLLYRHYITLKPLPGEEESVENAFEECALRSREMCLLYRRLYQSSSIQFTWGSLHILFVGGLTYLYCLWKSQRVRQRARQSDVINTCMACNTVLVIIAERWSQATTYRDTFEALSEKTINMICNDSSGPVNSSLATTFDETQFQNMAPPVSQDWIMSLDDLSIPNESEWFVQELLQGMRDFQQPDISFDDLADFVQ
ncbi:hypothetical protein BS50DRAFT_144331 [Corynespora cassiicola Philippines]|uniref:Zn(2)-C6 fungal-type domain-containing protein n=1 Tax=Corynespora cassiicola Philippines TaxID=1448308 RepID=A0A2T2N8E6_CORCC|nr:hypothetical protein BS50DRAFT_144331 [Corynespora cassiicola Philippines]